LEILKPQVAKSPSQSLVSNRHRGFWLTGHLRR
jgi:hypothetical protein